MIRLDHRTPTPPDLRGAILALGNFDGFHLGHQAVVGDAVAWARAEGRPAIVATFDPHPISLFRPDAPPFRLTSLDQRQELFAAAGVDAMLVFQFDRAMAATSASAWVEQVIARDIGAAGVVTGADFTFGQGREGDVAALGRLGAGVGLRACAVAPVVDDGPRGDGASISSSRIREALVAGEAETATRLMTRPYAIRGVVQHGDKVGRTIGFPTANLAMGSYLRPAYGIYAVRGRLPGGRQVIGAANLGIRPSFDPPKLLLEPYFFDFGGDLYGAEIEVALCHFLRPERKFDSLDALSAQMARDCVAARALLANPLLDADATGKAAAP